GGSRPDDAPAPPSRQALRPTGLRVPPGPSVQSPGPRVYSAPHRPLRCRASRCRPNRHQRKAKGDTNVESQTPPRPPEKQEPPKSETVWISPRLREKLDDGGGDAPRQGGGSPLVGIVLALLVAGGGIGLFMAMRSGAAREKAAAEHQARLAAQAAAAESVANA